LFNNGGLFYGKVVDFIDIDFFNVSIFGYHLSRWPIFNIADSSVTVGVLILLIFHRSFVIEDEESRKPSLEPAAASSDAPPKISS
jgi:signal peptidase II